MNLINYNIYSLPTEDSILLVPKRAIGYNDALKRLKLCHGGTKRNKRLTVIEILPIMS